MMSQKYVRVCEGLNDKGSLIDINEFNETLPVFESTTDQYASIYYYNEEQFKTFQQKGSVSKIEDVKTNKLAFDFDSKDNIDLAKNDVIKLYKTLENYKVTPQMTELYFSGCKGYTVVLNLSKEVSPEKTQELATEVFGKDLNTLDVGIYNASRILRLPNSKHPKSGLYKIPITYEQFIKNTPEQIKELARKPGKFKLGPTVELNPELLQEKIKQVEVKEAKREFNIRDIDWTRKPRHWKDYRWAIAQGYFKSGDRHNALMVLAATCRGLGYDKEQTYYLCKSSIKKQAEITGQNEFDKSELWTNIIEQSIFSDNWEGGQYSPETNGWLKKYCIEHKFKWDKEEDKPIITLDEMNAKFDDYAKNFDKNILKTGLTTLDENVMLLASTLTGLLGQPGSGKTSVAMKALKTNSLTGNQSTFFSMDMGLPIVHAKLIQNLKGYPFKKVMDIYKHNPKEANELIEEVKRIYKNVGFNFKSGLNVADMKEIIKKQEDQSGKPSKLVVVDYLECVASDFSDPTAATGKVANQLKDLANELNTCVLLLLQTQKHSVSAVSDPLLSMKQVKGSSVLEQAMSVILTLWREGYDPKTVHNDKYLSFACVKNRFGPLWSDDFSWDGKRGEVRELQGMEREDLEAFREERVKAKAAEKEKGEWS